MDALNQGVETVSVDGMLSRATIKQVGNNTRARQLVVLLHNYNGSGSAKQRFFVQKSACQLRTMAVGERKATTLSGNRHDPQGRHARSVLQLRKSLTE